MDKVSIIRNIEEHYDAMSTSEKTVADFFMQNKISMDFSSKYIKDILYVSEATLSRYAKKCGFDGYREFIYHYKQTLINIDEPIDKNIENVVNTYHQLLQVIYTDIDPNQIDRIVTMLEQADQVYVYGIGSSGLVAHEIKSRFMRIGLNIEALSDNELILMQSTLTDKHKLVIGITLSGKKQAICTALKQAKHNKANTIIITANSFIQFKNQIDEFVKIPSLKNLDYGNIITPQFSILVFFDVLYSSYQKVNCSEKENMLQHTLEALNRE